MSATALACLDNAGHTWNGSLPAFGWNSFCLSVGATYCYGREAPWTGQSFLWLVAMPDGRQVLRLWRDIHFQALAQHIDSHGGLGKYALSRSAELRLYLATDECLRRCIRPSKVLIARLSCPFSLFPFHHALVHC